VLEGLSPPSSQHFLGLWLFSLARRPSVGLLIFPALPLPLKDRRPTDTGEDNPGHTPKYAHLLPFPGFPFWPLSGRSIRLFTANCVSARSWGLFPHALRSLPLPPLVKFRWSPLCFSGKAVGSPSFPSFPFLRAQRPALIMLNLVPSLDGCPSNSVSGSLSSSLFTLTPANVLVRVPPAVKKEVSCNSRPPAERFIL